MSQKPITGKRLPRCPYFVDGWRGRPHNIVAMRKALVVAFVLLLSCAPAWCQQPAPATKQDVEELLTLTGAKTRVQQIWAQMGQQMATTAADSYHLKHPDATPLQLYKVSQIAGKSFQSGVGVLSVDEMIAAIIPIYQQHLSHADVQAIIAFYHTPAGQTYLKEQPAMQSESMKAMEPIIKKHLPEIQSASDKAIQKAMYPSAVSSREGNGSGK